MNINFAEIALTRFIRMRSLMSVEAGRPANPSNPKPCDCPVCRSDCARITPCQRESN